MDVEDAIELGQRSIYHATYRDAVSGGTVSGTLSCPLCFSRCCHRDASAAQRGMLSRWMTGWQWMEISILRQRAPGGEGGGG